MRPKMSPILQQNNNNNYPCLSAAGPGPLPHKCSLPLPFSSRSELSLTGLPLIRGLRAWALCSRSRHRPGGPLGQAPLSHPRPADVHLSAEWGLPLGPEARRAGIGALVATLQTSEGSSRTQTQCLFLRTDRGSCLYPTTKPTLHTTPQQPGGILRGWLKSKTGGPPALPSNTGHNRARDRSGRRWRKPANHTASRERAHFRQHQQHETREKESTQVQLRKEQGGESRHEPREESKDQPREESRDQPRDQSREESRHEPQEESRDEPREENREKTKDEAREVTQNPPKDQSRNSSREVVREEEEEYTENISQRSRNHLGKDSREDSRDLPREVHVEEQGEVSQKLLENLCHTAKLEKEFTVHTQKEELVKEAQVSPCPSRKDVSDAQDMSDGAELSGPSHHPGCALLSSPAAPLSSPACTLTGPPAGGSNCTANPAQADPLTVGWGPLEQSCPLKLCRNFTQDRTLESEQAEPRGHSADPQREHPCLDLEKEQLSLCLDKEHPSLNPQCEPPSTNLPSLDPQREHPSLDPKREHPSLDLEGEHPSLDLEGEHPSLDLEGEPWLEEQEFGGFMQAPPVCSHECDGAQWSDGGPAGTNCSWDQSDSAWAVFPLDQTNTTDQGRDQGGQWWPVSSMEDTGSASGARHSSVCVFAASFPSPPACCSSGPWDSSVPTLTQLLRHSQSPQEASSEQRLLDPFHDLNKMIVQGYKQTSGVSQELLQRSLSRAPANTGIRVGPSHRSVSPGNTFQQGHASSTHL